MKALLILMVAAVAACTTQQEQQACRLDQIVPALEASGKAAAELAAPGSTQDADKAAAIAAQAHAAAVAICASIQASPASP